MSSGPRSLFGKAALAVLFVLPVAGLMSGPGLLAQEDHKPHVEVYGFVQADYIQDFDRVNPAWNDTLRPSRIPTEDDVFGADGQASVSARQSRLGVLMNFPTSNKPVYTKFEFDMFGVGPDEGKTTIRLRHAFGQWGPWLAGQTNSLFMDASIFPNVIDYWGPAGMVFLRTPQIRYTPFRGDNSLSFAIEKPGNDVDPGGVGTIDPGLGAAIRGSQEVPDITAQFRSEHSWGHFQVASIFRKVSFDTPGFPDSEPKGQELGWGFDGTGSIKVGKKDKVLLGAVIGEGIASYMNDGGMDLAPEVHGTRIDPEVVPLTGISAYYDHYWSDRYSSSFGYSQTVVDNTNFQLDDAFHAGRYASGNFLCYPTENVFVGGEALWGQREDNGGATGKDFRIQISFHYSFSTKDVFKKALS